MAPLSYLASLGQSTCLYYSLMIYSLRKFALLSAATILFLLFPSFLLFLPDQTFRKFQSLRTRRSLSFVQSINVDQWIWGSKSVKSSVGHLFLFSPLSWDGLLIFWRHLCVSLSISVLPSRINSLRGNHRFFFTLLLGHNNFGSEY